MTLNNPHAASIKICLDALKTTTHGLSAAEAAQRLQHFGANRLPEVHGRSVWLRFLGQFNNVLIYVLLAAAVVTALLQHWVDTSVIVVLVWVNAMIGFVQEGKAEAAMAAIRQMLAPHATVLRDRQRQTVEGADIVPGDVVLLEAGDKVPADVRIIQAHRLAAQEAILTGESVPVDKDTTPVADDAVLAERHSMLWSGTLITQGTARALVVATGARTEIGRIGGLLAQVQQISTPLVEQIDHFSRWLSFLVVLGAGLLLLYGYRVQQHDFAELLMVVVALAVAAIPEGLPAVMTITLAMGVQAMARHHAIVRRLPAIEAIGSVSVICTDKTGTLTRNEMMVVAAETPVGSFSLTGQGYTPVGVITPDGDLSRLAHAAALCNDAALHWRDGQWHVEGDPMEGALLAFAGKVGGVSTVQRLDAIPFDSQHRYMAVLTEGAEEGMDGRVIYLKGAPERVFAMCAGLDSAHWHARATQLAQRGLRVLALAQLSTLDSKINTAALGHGLHFLGLLGLMDPPRTEAIKAVAQCYQAGISVKMITGDHAGTAAAIAAQIGLLHPERVLTGHQLDKLDDAQLALQVTHVNVFARTSPEHKLRLVTALQANGLSVAMTGDGVNDAPALKRADAGVAMGLKGSEAAKEAADVVLTDDNFATIVAAVREGRTVWDNLKKVISWTLPTNAGESLVVVFALILGWALPVTAVQILWINLITAITLGLALAFEPTEAGTMQRPPRARHTPILTGELVWHVLLVSSLFGLAIFGIFSYAMKHAYPLPLAQTMAMNTLVVLEIFHLFFVRNIHGTSFTWAAIQGTRIIWLVLLCVVLAQCAVTYLVPLQTLLGTAPVSLMDGLFILAVGVGFFAVLETEKQIRLALKRRKTH